MDETQNNSDDELFVNFFNKQSKNRKDSDIRAISKYLCQKYTYFINIKSSKDYNRQKIEKIIKYAKLEEIPAKTVVFNYGETGDKFYIILEGSVSIYKPEFKEVLLTAYEFYEIINGIKNTDILKYERILQKNADILGKNTKDLSFIAKNRPFYSFQKKNFFLEKFHKAGVFGEGFTFGEMAVLRRTARNATVITNTKSLFLTIAKKDYNIAIRELHDKKLNKDFDQFIKDFPIFINFHKELILDILNNVSRKTVFKGEYLYQKDEEDDNIYFINNGIFNLSFNFSFAWLNDYLIYFNDNSGNMIMYLLYKKPRTFSELTYIIENQRKELNDKYENIFKDNNFDYNKWEKCISKKNEDNFMGIKTEEDKLNSENKVFNINIKNIQAKEILGLEEALECKKKFFTVKCISDHADVMYIKGNNLIKICRSLKQKELYEFLGFLIQRKDVLVFQLLNKVRYLEKDILFTFNNKYEMMKGNEYDIKKESDKDRIISTIKFKGFKTRIDELLDKGIDISSYVKYSTAYHSLNFQMVNPTQKDIIDKNQKNIDLLKKIMVESVSNHHLLKLKNNISHFNFKNIPVNPLTNTKNKTTTKFSFSPLSTSSKHRIFIKEKTYDNFNIHTFYNEKGFDDKIEFNDNSSPKMKSSENKLFTKLLPNLDKNKRKFFKELSNKMVSSYSLPKKIISSLNNTEIIEKEKKKNCNGNNIKINILNKENFFRKINKKKNIFKESLKLKDIDDDKNTNKKLFLKEKSYYDLIESEQKEFFLGERFNRKFMNEYNKIKPIHYHSFHKKIK